MRSCSSCTCHSCSGPCSFTVLSSPAACTPDAKGITYNEHVNIALAVTMPDGGLITPVLKVSLALYDGQSCTVLFCWPCDRAISPGITRRGTLQLLPECWDRVDLQATAEGARRSSGSAAWLACC